MLHPRAQLLAPHPWHRALEISEQGCRAHFSRNWFPRGVTWLSLSLVGCPHLPCRLSQDLPHLLVLGGLHDVSGRPEGEQPRGLCASHGMRRRGVLGQGRTRMQGLPRQVPPLHGARGEPVSDLPAGQPSAQWVTSPPRRASLSLHPGDSLVQCLVPCRNWCLFFFFQFFTLYLENFEAYRKDARGRIIQRTLHTCPVPADPRWPYICFLSLTSL